MPITFSTAPGLPADADIVAVPVFENRLLVPGASPDVDVDFLEARDFEGSLGQTWAISGGDGPTVLVVGLGDPDTLTLDGFRRAGAAVVKGAWKSPSVAVALLDALPAGVDPATAAQALAEGMALGAHQFTVYKSTTKPCAIASVTVVSRDGAAVQAGLDLGARIAGAVTLARDLVNEPPKAMTPRRLEEVAREIAESNGLEIEVWDEVTITAEGLGGLEGVAAGSEEPPRLIKLRYEPEGATETVAIVGKGITFDSGGLSIKTGEGMMTMKSDMGGAAVVLAVMSAITAVHPDVRVHAFAACSENLPGRRAIKPGDVLKIRNGKTVEVLNTDAEGRLVLADALSLAVEEAPDAIVDLATLTGACVTALGPDFAGIMGNDDGLIARVEAAAERAGEPMWALPLPKAYRKQIDSEVADLKNIGAPGGRGGALIAGLFLQEFVDGLPWVHLDIAGPAFRSEEDGYLPKGGTGFGVRTILELLAGFGAPPA